MFPTITRLWWRNSSDAVVELDGNEKLEAIFRRMAINAKSLHSPEMQNRELADRVAQLARILSDSSYIAEWQ